jgi:hydroxymethylbilane synthase
MAQTQPIRLGTRGSRLALWQAEAVRRALIAAHHVPADTVAIVPIRTTGDRIRDRPLSEAGGKGLFTKEIEEALKAGEIDAAVHSAKDMQTVLPEGLVIGACLEREDVRDALVAPNYSNIESLSRGARIGTASLRREALVKRARPDLTTALLRGNVPTRIERVRAGDFDATLLAAAGLKRLQLESAITTLLSLDVFPPACGQGAIAAECREDDRRMRDLLAGIDDKETTAAITCERAFLAVLEGSCRTPIAGYARRKQDVLEFSGLVLAADGQESYTAAGSGAPDAAAEIGRAAGEVILRIAPRRFLEQIGIG